MAGEDKQTIYVPPTGVYEGTLQEDMVDTVARTHKQYIKVHIEGLFDKDGEYPYTYVPDWGLVLPLHQGDKVLVQFEHGSLLYPVLYRNPNELDTGLYQKYNVPTPPSVAPSGTNPHTGEGSEDTISAHRFEDGSYVICTQNYTIFHFLNGYLLIDKYDNGSKNRVFVQGDNVFVMSKETLNLYADGDITVKNNSNITIDSAPESSVTINGHLKVTK